MRALVLLLFLIASALPAQSRSVRIADLPWTEAERVLDSSVVVVIPVGAEAKEHGPHLRLNNDWLLAEYFAKRVFAASRIVLYLTVNYHFYPSFVEYPGSTTLRQETARDVIVDIVRSIARHGPRRFYILNTGVSTLRALKPSQDSLAASGILMHYTDILQVGKEAEDRIRQHPANLPINYDYCERCASPGSARDASLRGEMRACPGALAAWTPTRGKQCDTRWFRHLTSRWYCPRERWRAVG